MPEPTIAEIRHALQTLRSVLPPGVYDQLHAQTNDWPEGMPKPPPYPADDEDDEAPDWPGPEMTSMTREQWDEAKEALDAG